jgi:uncharacterized membrane protein YoaK (UPF0700 family)
MKMSERSKNMLVQVYFSILASLVLGIIFGNVFMVVLSYWGILVCGPVIFIVYKLIEGLEKLRNKWSKKT